MRAYIRRVSAHRRAEGPSSRIVDAFGECTRTRAREGNERATVAVAGRRSGISRASTALATRAGAIERADSSRVFFCAAFMPLWDSPRARVGGASAMERFARFARFARADEGTTGETLALDAASSEAGDEVRHLRRHVDALTRACAEAEARARAAGLEAERAEALRRENAALREREDGRAGLETRLRAAEARANAARDALVSAKVRHEEALARARGEAEDAAQRRRVEAERWRSEARVMEDRLSELERLNGELENDLREYRAETAHLDEVIAQHEEDLARLTAEKRAVERELAAKSAASIRTLVMSPFSPKIQPESTPRLVAALRWFEDVVSPLRASTPFADLANDEASATPVSKQKSRLGAGMSPIPRTPGAFVEDSAEEDARDESDEESVGVASPLALVDPTPAVASRTKRGWSLSLSKVPMESFHGRPMRELGALRVRVVGSVSLAALA